MKIFSEDTFSAKDVQLVEVNDRILMNFEVKAVRIRQDGERVFRLLLYCGVNGEDSVEFNWTPEGLMPAEKEEG